MVSSPPVLETTRLTIRPFNLDDVGFIVNHFNEPSFIEGITDKGIRTLDDATAYLNNSIFPMYQAQGFGLCAVELKATGEVIGTCGLLKRDELDGPDLGYSLLKNCWHQGYAREAAQAVLTSARQDSRLSEVLAIINPDNAASLRLVQSLGFELVEQKAIKDEGPILQILCCTLTLAG